MSQVQITFPSYFSKYNIPRIELQNSVWYYSRTSMYTRLRRSWLIDSTHCNSWRCLVGQPPVAICCGLHQQLRPSNSSSQPNKWSTFPTEWGLGGWFGPPEWWYATLPNKQVPREFNVIAIKHNLDSQVQEDTLRYWRSASARSEFGEYVFCTTLKLPRLSNSTIDLQSGDFSGTRLSPGGTERPGNLC